MKEKLIKAFKDSLGNDCIKNRNGNKISIITKNDTEIEIMIDDLSFGGIYLERSAQPKICNKTQNVWENITIDEYNNLKKLYEELDEI
jgi:hypothetical protein